jgi:hypothetical protein
VIRFIASVLTETLIGCQEKASVFFFFPDIAYTNKGKEFTEE